MTVDTTAYREFHGYIHVLCSIQYAVITQLEWHNSDNMLLVLNY